MNLKYRKSLFLLLPLSGILLSLPWIMSGFSWALFFALVPLLAFSDRTNTQKQSPHFFTGFQYTYVSFLIWNVFSAWWISYVSFAGMVFVLGLNALLMSLVWTLAHWVGQKTDRTTGYFALVVFWIGFEFFHFHWTLQWPWLNLGNGFANSVQWIQWYEFTGVLGGTLWILLSNILIYELILNRSGKLQKVLKALSIAMLIVVPIGFSSWLYANFDDHGAEFEVVILQPNLDPYTRKYSTSDLQEQVKKLISLTQSKLSAQTRLIVAPETSLPTFWEDSVLNENSPVLPLRSFLNHNRHAAFIGGSNTQLRLDNMENLPGGARKSVDGKYAYQVYNTAVMLEPDSGTQFSHKNILINGVEKMPFQKILSVFEKFMLNLGGTSGSLTAGKEPEMLVLKDSINIGPVICFESAFGGYCNRFVKKGAEILLVITNDGWWKDASGIDQHFSYSGLRAIETRRNIIRSANTGISGVIDSRGEVKIRTKVNTTNSIRSSAHTNNAVTFYVRYGDYLGWICSVLSGFILVFLLIIFKINKSGK